MDREDIIGLIIILIFMLLVVGVLIFIIYGIDKVAENQNSACQKLGYDKFMGRGFKEYCVDTSTGKSIRVISQCGINKESCVMVLYS